MLTPQIGTISDERAKDDNNYSVGANEVAKSMRNGARNYYFFVESKNMVTIKKNGLENLWLSNFRGVK